MDRYCLTTTKHPANNGGWVRYEDAQAEIADLKSEIAELRVMDNTHETTLKLLRVIERFREIDAEMQAQSIAVLLKVAKHPVPIRMADIAAELGLSQSTISRNVAYLGDWNRHKEVGHKLLEAYEDPMERRRKLVKLTAKGRRFVKSLNEIIQEAR